jgi:hypothetical protein
MAEGKKIVIISDGSGRTAKRLLDSVMVQYHEHDLEFYIDRIYSQIRQKRDLNKILNSIDPSYLVLYTVVSKETCNFLSRKLRKRSILHLDVLKPMMDTMYKFLGFHPDFRPGLLKIVDDAYYRKVESISYTVGHDDGRGNTVEDADAILVGPSRTCKTPISMYLACNHGIRVANIPMVLDRTMTQNLLERVQTVPPRKVIGLLMRPDVLARVREDRMNVMLKQGRHQEQLQTYFDLRDIAVEYRYCRDMYITRGWQTVDVTRRAIEEISREILKKLGRPI